VQFRSHQVTHEKDIPAEARQLAPVAPEESFVCVPVVTNEVITAQGYERQSRLLTFDVSTTKEQYRTGGHVMIQAVNEDSLVERVAKRLHLDLDAVVRITAMDPSAEAALGGRRLPPVASVRRILKCYLDLNGIPSRATLEEMSLLATDPKEKQELEHMAVDMLEGNEYARLISSDYFSVVDALERFSSVKVTLDHLLSRLLFIQPRYYSIASSPLLNKNRLQVVLVIDEWKGKSGKVFRPQAGTYLASLKPGANVVLKFQHGLLNLPHPDIPILGVALGTGIGVFRGILQDQQALQDKGDKNISRIRLYYGIRHRAKDFLFEKELEQYQQHGLVELIMAFSHDNPAKFETVGDRITELPTKAFDYLSHDAQYIYCGLGGSIPGFVEDALVTAIDKCRSETDLEGATYVDKMKSEGRFQVEAYSKGFDEENVLRALGGRGDKGRAAALDQIPIAEQYHDAKMFCFQCEQTNQGRGCTTIGVCGKTPEVAAIQDLLIAYVKRLSWFAHRLRTLGRDKKLPENEYEIPAANHFTLLAIFSTLTNVNFDPLRFVDFVDEAIQLTGQYETKYVAACHKTGTTVATCPLPSDMDVDNILGRRKGGLAGVADVEDLLVRKGKAVGVLARFRATKNDALVGLQEMLVYGLKGVCAYADHAYMLAHEDARIYEFVHEAMMFLTTPEARSVDNVLGMLMRCGSTNIITMDLLHRANSTFGAQSPHTVAAKPQAGKCILVSGHDLKMIEEILKQTEGKGINVYTHGEMLPTHGYPKLRAYKHLAGHYGLAWQRQSLEFPHFPGAIVMTTNCITRPREDYGGRLFTAGAVGWPDIPHIGDLNFKPVIDMAIKCDGFRENALNFDYPVAETMPGRESYTVGFGSEAVIANAGAVLDAISKGDISRIYVIGGCDGYEGERNYFTELARMLPPTSVVLTAGCGKYRINHLEYGTIGQTGIPRLLDLGQCNDSYSAVQIATALAAALNCTVHDLPISIFLSWFEQKAIAVLLSLLSIGLKHIRVGPQLPAFLRPSILKVLESKFDLKLVGDPTKDLNEAIKGPQPVEDITVATKGIEVKA